MTDYSKITDKCISTPICEECDVPMQPFAHETKDGWIAGWACASCGWSFDTDEIGDSDDIHKI